MAIRDDIVDNARWGADNESMIHYSQGAGRMDAVHSPRQLPLYTDCSGFVTYCYAWAGAPDPNGYGYDGVGFTGSLLDHLEHISADEIQPGDLIVFGPGTGDHVVIAVESGSDPMCVSHGQEAGPITIRLSRVATAHRPPTTYLRGGGLDAPAQPVQEDDQMTPEQSTQAIMILVDIQRKIDDLEKRALSDDQITALFDPTYGIYKKVANLEVLVGAIAKKVGV